jgi:putative aldouronate transport system substrate-binding protein
MLNAMIMADGNIYALPQYRPSTWDLTPYRLYFNRAWAEKLGIKVPATIGELRNALLAFRDGDPNGNGKKDEIGLYGYYNGTYGQNTIVAILNSFVFYNPGALALDDSGNTVTAPFTAPAFRKGIQYLNGLYRDGLLSAALFTDDLQQFRATLNSNPPVVGIASMGSTSNYPNTDTNANYQEMAPMIPPLTGPDGVCYTPYSEYVPPLTTFIASKSSNPDLAFKFIESFLEPDISLISRYGEEGVDWSRKPGDLAKTSNSYVELGLYPALTLVELKNIWGNPSNKHWHNVGAGYGNLALQNTVGILYSPFDPSLPSQVHNAVNYQYYTPRHPDHILPLLRYTLEDTERNSQIITDVNEYVRQSIAEFVIGARDINSDAAWGAYIRELENLGLSQWIQRAQATYNRQKGR